MRNTPTATPFEEGNRAAKQGLAPRNPHPDGSVEHRNYELGRQFGLRYLRGGDTFRVNTRSAG